MTDRQFNTFPKEFSDQLGNKINGKQTDQIAFVFMQMLVEDESPIENAIRTGTNTGLTVGGATFYLGGIKFIPEEIGITVGTAIFSAWTTYFQTAENQALAVHNCGPLVGSDEKARYGCSLITPVDFNDVTSLKKFCNGGIEGKI